jgi:ornithine cyclodeaminase
MSVTIVAAEAEARLDWLALTRALEAGHATTGGDRGYVPLPRGRHAPEPGGLDRRDGPAGEDGDRVPGQRRARGAPSINGGVSLFSDRDGTLEAILDFHLVTKWKTAGDSLLAAHEARAEGTRARS